MTVDKRGQEYFDAAREVYRLRPLFGAAGPETPADPPEEETTSPFGFDNGKETFLQLAASGNAEGLMPRMNGALSGMGGSSGGESEEAKKKKDFERQMLAQIDENLRAINERIANLQEQSQILHQKVEEIDAQMQERERKIDEYARSHENAIRALREFEEKHEFQRDADGKLANKDAQRLLDEYIRRTGQRPESDAAIYQAVQRQIEWERQEAERLGREKTQLGEDRKKAQDDIKKVDDETERLQKNSMK